MPGPTISEIARLSELPQQTLYRWQREENLDIRNPREIWKRMQFMPSHTATEPPVGLQLLLSLNVRWEK
jgi:hypothetical protein